MLESNTICPKCYSLLQKKGNDIVCTNCSAKYHKGDEIKIPLKELLKIKNKENRIINKSKPRPKEARILNRKRHSTGFYGVTRLSPRRGKPKGGWRYRSKAFNLNILRVDLNTLKNDVLELGGEWKVVNEEVAKKSIEINKRYNNV